MPFVGTHGKVASIVFEPAKSFGMRLKKAASAAIQTKVGIESSALALCSGA